MGSVPFSSAQTTAEVPEPFDPTGVAAYQLPHGEDEKPRSAAQRSSLTKPRTITFSDDARWSNIASSALFETIANQIVRLAHDETRCATQI